MRRPRNHLPLFTVVAGVGLLLSVVGAVRMSAPLLAIGFVLPWLGLAIATKLDDLW